MRLAFKDGKIAAESAGDKLGAFFSRSIVLATGGRFSHVEVVLSGPPNRANCFSAIEPIGCRYAVIDLTKPPGMWTVLEFLTTPDEDLFIQGFCAGSDGKPYDSLGIVGIGAESGIHDPRDRFCSEFATELSQKALQLFLGVTRWMVAPSGPCDGKRYGLYELCISTPGWNAVAL